MLPPPHGHGAQSPAPFGMCLSDQVGRCPWLSSGQEGRCCACMLGLGAAGVPVYSPHTPNQTAAGFTRGSPLACHEAAFPSQATSELMQPWRGRPTSRGSDKGIGTCCLGRNAAQAPDRSCSDGNGRACPFSSEKPQAALPLSLWAMVPNHEWIAETAAYESSKASSFCPRRVGPKAYGHKT